MACTHTQTLIHSFIPRLTSGPSLYLFPEASNVTSPHTAVFSSSWNVLSSQGERPIELGGGIVLGLALTPGWSPDPPNPLAPGPSFQQLIHLTAPCCSPRPSYWQPHPGKDSQLSSCSIPS